MEPLWDANYIIHEAVEEIRSKAGDGRVLCAVSGGLDSAVAAKLAHMAVGDRLTCLFVDTGLFRKDEPEEVAEAFRGDARTSSCASPRRRPLFLKALEGVRAEAEKERIVSSLLKQVFYEQIRDFPDVKAIVLGTNYNDALYGQPVPVRPPVHSEDQYIDHGAGPRAVSKRSQAPGRAARHTPNPSWTGSPSRPRALPRASSAR